jgi:hypothetical protein
MNRLSSVVLLLILTCSAFTQTPNTPPSSRTRVAWQPPRWDDLLNELPTATVPKEMVGAFRVSNFPIEFEQTKIDDVRTRLGGIIGHKGDAGEYREWLCFHGKNSEGRWVLWLENGEIDGGRVGSFRWERLPTNAELDQRCRILQRKAGGIVLPISLRLGTTEKEVLKTLGTPTVRRGDRLIYIHEHDETIRGEPFTSNNIVEVRLRGGTVCAIEVSKTVSS